MCFSATGFSPFPVQHVNSSKLIYMVRTYCVLYNCMIFYCVAVHMILRVNRAAPAVRSVSPPPFIQHEPFFSQKQRTFKRAFRFLLEMLSPVVSDICPLRFSSSSHLHEILFLGFSPFFACMYRSTFSVITPHHEQPQNLSGLQSQHLSEKTGFTSLVHLWQVALPGVKLYLYVTLFHANSSMF